MFRFALRKRLVRRLCNFSEVNRQLRRIDAAEDNLKEALRILRGADGRDPNSGHSITDVLNSLGDHYKNQKRGKDALACYEESLAISRDLARNDHNELFSAALTLDLIGNLHRDERRIAEAKAAYDEAIKYYRELAVSDGMYDNPVFLAKTLERLAGVNQIENKIKDARDNYEEALGIYQKCAEREQARSRDVSRVERALRLLAK